jgi:hypothetical protein
MLRPLFRMADHAQSMRGRRRRRKATGHAGAIAGGASGSWCIQIAPLDGRQGEGKQHPISTNFDEFHGFEQCDKRFTLTCEHMLTECANLLVQVLLKNFQSQLLLRLGEKVLELFHAHGFDHSQTGNLLQARSESRGALCRGRADCGGIHRGSVMQPMDNQKECEISENLREVRTEHSNEIFSDRLKLQNQTSEQIHMLFESSLQVWKLSQDAQKRLMTTQTPRHCDCQCQSARRRRA